MDEVLYEPRDRIAYITLNRPEALNGISEGVLDGMVAALRAIREDRSLKAAVITGAGEPFCVGLDIGLLAQAFDDRNYFREVLARLRRILLDIERSPVPVIAAVNGLARAGGFEMMLACDMAVIAEEARIGDTHLAFGLLPGGGASVRLQRRIGYQRAREIILTGRWLEPGEAVSIGLALRSVPRARLAEAVEELVARFRTLSRPALAATKEAMNEVAALPIEEATDEEISQFMRFLASEPSAREGFDATVQKRAPVWD